MHDAMNTEPLFAPEAQESFSPGDRVYLIYDSGELGEGAEGTYQGHLGERTAVIDFDTPSGKPYRLAVHFANVRQLYV